jgi:hypothetical protein
LSQVFVATIDFLGILFCKSLNLIKMKQLFYLMLLCASILIVSCNKEVADNPNLAGIETQKLSANSISLDEAKATYLKAAKEARSSVVGGTPLNLADFDPQWSQADGINYVDTSGNAFTVPAAFFQPGGYKKLIFFRYNGQTTFLVVTVRGTREYLARKRGQCTMDDFCGDVYYTNTDGVSTGGYRLLNGVVTAFLVPDNRPRVELEGGEDEYGWKYQCVVTASGNGGNGGTIANAVNFSLFNTMMYNNLPTFNNNTFGSGNNNGGGPPADNSSMNGNAPPTFDQYNPMCQNSFNFVNEGTVGTTVVNMTAGLQNVVFSFNGLNGQTITATFTKLTFTVEKVIGNQVSTSTSAANAATNAVNEAYDEVQALLNNPNGGISPTRAAVTNKLLNTMFDKMGNAHGTVQNFSAGGVNYVNAVACP